MKATPAEVANDLAANAAFFHKRDKQTADACHECACMIRRLLERKLVDGRTYFGLRRRMVDLCDRYCRSGSHIGVSLLRGLAVMTDLWRAKEDPK